MYMQLETGVYDGWIQELDKAEPLHGSSNMCGTTGGVASAFYEAVVFSPDAALRSLFSF